MASLHTLPSSSDPALPAVAVEYHKLIVPSLSEMTEKEMSDIVTSLQGETVEIYDTREYIVAMKLFHFIYKYSTECVYRTLKNNRYMLFDHQVVPIIRDENILHYWTSDEAVPKPVQPYLELNIEDLWNQTSGNEFERTRQLIHALQTFPRAIQITFLGTAPTLVFLFAQEYFEGPCQSLVYQKTKDSEKVTIY